MPKKKIFKSLEEKEEYDKLYREKQSLRAKRYSKENANKIKERLKKWIENNPDKIKSYRDKNKDSVLENSKKWQKENKEQAYNNHLRYREKNRNKINEYSKTYRTINKEERLTKRRERNKIKLNNEPIYRLSENIRGLISKSFRRGNKNFKKRNSTEEILGCSIEFFIDYIISKAPEGIKIEDFGKFGYHIDHIIPISLAKTECEVIKLCHYTNFQPLWWKDNISKSNKLI